MSAWERALLRYKFRKMVGCCKNVFKMLWVEPDPEPLLNIYNIFWKIGRSSYKIMSRKKVREWADQRSYDGLTDHYKIRTILHQKGRGYLLDKNLRGEMKLRHHGKFE